MICLLVVLVIESVVNLIVYLVVLVVFWVVDMIDYLIDYLIVNLIVDLVVNLVLLLTGFPFPFLHYDISTGLSNGDVMQTMLGLDQTPLTEELWLHEQIVLTLHLLAK
jgi:hypothetical protein